MENKEEERYVSLRLADSDMDEVQRIIGVVNESTERRLKAMLLRHAIIAYSRPFKGVKGVFQKKFTPLVANVIPGLGLAEHEEIITERDTKVAHGDISEYKPVLSYWTKFDFFPMTIRSSQLYQDLDRLSEKIEILTSHVQAYVQSEMFRMEAEFRKHIQAQLQSTGGNGGIIPVSDKN